jgi:3-phenylpropionate/trans-cinnamate dioxygenase ferredoxin reductase component
MRDVVVVGAALAGLRTAEALRREGYDGRLFLVGAETHQPYDRPPLSKAFMADGLGHADLLLRQPADLRAEWLLGRTARRLDQRERRIELCDRSALRYDGLVVATGASPRRLPGIDPARPGIHELRTLDDALRLRDELAGSPRVVIIGGGFIGAELASTCRKLGLDVTVVTPLPLLVTALGPLAEAATARARDHGVRVIDTAAVTGVTGTGRADGVQLSDGRMVPADVVVVAIGAVPQTGWLDGSGATLREGVVCDETLAVDGVTGAVAVGDVARWPHAALGGGTLRTEHWTSAVEQARAAARRLVHGTAEAHAPVPTFWSDQFGTRIQGVGLPSYADDVTVVDGDAAGDTFVAEYRRHGDIVGAVVGGAAAALLPYRRELAERLRSPLKL